MVWRSEPAIARGPGVRERTAVRDDGRYPRSHRHESRRGHVAHAPAAPAVGAAGAERRPRCSCRSSRARSWPSGKATAASPGGWRSAGSRAGPSSRVGEIFVAALEGGRVVGLDARDRRKKWEQQVGGTVTGLAGQGKHVYAGSLDNFFYCLEAATGRIKWRWRTGRRRRRRAERRRRTRLLRVAGQPDSGVGPGHRRAAMEEAAGRPSGRRARCASGTCCCSSSLSAELRAVDGGDEGRRSAQYDLGRRTRARHPSSARGTGPPPTSLSRSPSTARC